MFFPFSIFNDEELREIKSELKSINCKLEEIMLKEAELVVLLKNLTAQVVKIKQEFADKIDALNEAIDNSDVVSADIVDAANELQLVLQNLDDANPDAVVQAEEVIADTQKQQ